MTGTNVARRESQAPIARTARAAQLQTDLGRFTGRLAEVLPKHITPERVITLTLVAATKTPQLFDCTTESIALSLMRVAQWGLEIGTTAHLVPFGKDCTPIADWKGLIVMIERAGVARDVKARCVYSNETFVVRGGTDETLAHEVIADDRTRGHCIAVYAMATVRGGGKTWEVMTKGEVEKIRQRAPSKNSPAWQNHWEEMAKKTAIRRLAKRLPQLGALADALLAEDRYEELQVVGELPTRRTTANMIPATHDEPEQHDDRQPDESTAQADAPRGDDPHVAEEDAAADIALDQQLVQEERKGVPPGGNRHDMPKGGKVEDAMKLPLGDEPRKPNRNAQMG